MVLAQLVQYQHKSKDAYMLLNYQKALYQTPLINLPILPIECIKYHEYHDLSTFSISNRHMCPKILAFLTKALLLFHHQAPLNRLNKLIIFQVISFLINQNKFQIQRHLQVQLILLGGIKDLVREITLIQAGKTLFLER